MTIGPMVPLTTTSSSFEARVIAAHLGAEGIVWELRGGVDGPYPVGPVVILVAETDLLLAREVVSEQTPEVLADAEAAGDADAGEGARAGGDVGEGSERALWLVLAVVLLAAATLLGRLLMLTWH